MNLKINDTIRKQIKIAILFIIAVELFCLLVLKVIGAPDYSYYSGYMNGYNYHPYQAYTTAHYPVYGNLEKMNQHSVVILGGSTAAGIGSSKMAKSYYYRLEQLLRHLSGNQKINIINIATPGYVSNQESAAYKNYIFQAKEAPALVMALSSFNDLYFYLFRSLPIGHHEFNYAFDELFRKGYPAPKQFGQKVLNIVRKSNIYAFVHKLIAPRSGKGKLSSIRLASSFDDPYPARANSPQTSIIQDAANNFSENHLSTAVLSSFKGTKYVLALQPIIYYGGTITEQKNEWFDHVSKLRTWVEDVGRMKTPFDLFFEDVFTNLKLKDRTKKIIVKDYRALFNNSEEVYLDPVHFNDRASEKLARKMAQDLLPYLPSK